MNPFTTTIFDFDKVISALTIPTPTLLLVKTSIYAWKQPYHSPSDIHGYLSLPCILFSPAAVYHLFDLKRSWSGALYFTRRYLFQRQIHSTDIWELLAGNLTTERWKANDTFGYQHRDGLCWSGGGLMSECRTSSCWVCLSYGFKPPGLKLHVKC